MRGTRRNLLIHSGAGRFPRPRTAGGVFGGEDEVVGAWGGGAEGERRAAAGGGSDGEVVFADGGEDGVIADGGAAAGCFDADGVPCEAFEGDGDVDGLGDGIAVGLDGGDFHGDFLTDFGGAVGAFGTEVEGGGMFGVGEGTGDGLLIDVGDFGFDGEGFGAGDAEGARDGGVDGGGALVGEC